MRSDRYIRVPEKKKNSRGLVQVSKSEGLLYSISVSNTTVQTTLRNNINDFISVGVSHESRIFLIFPFSLR